ncbi:MAG TPA: plastocyanin/azurin family copper-binding protein [Gemmatimonadaceae bacterium]
MRNRFAVLVLAGFLSTAACGGGGDGTTGVTGGTTGGTTGGNTGGSASPTLTTSVTVSDDAFTPASIQVSPGQTVTWTWDANASQHNVTFDDGATGSGTVSGGASFSRTFSTAGTFTYHCTLHSIMTGSVLVK